MNLNAHELRHRARSRRATAARPRFVFDFIFADGTWRRTSAATPGDARADLKRQFGKLPKVIEKRRTPL